MSKRKAANNFMRARGGNFAMMFAFATLPIIAFVGMLIEYNNLSKVQHQLQAAIDATALLLGKDYNETGTIPSDSEIKELIKSNFDGNLTTVTATVINGELVVTAAVKTDAIFTNSFGLSFDQNADVTVPLKHSDTGFEVALVLDSTGSMGSDNKMVDLKIVAKQFVTDIMDVSEEEGFTTTMSIIPFEKYVNVGPGNRDEDWISLVTHGGDFNPVFVDKAGSAVWNGCVGSRALPLNTTDGDYATPVPGLVNEWCATPITALTDSESILHGGIDALIPSGWTYVGHGVMWGLRTLTPAEPFTEARDPNPNLRKIMVVMTDGDNTRGPEAAGSVWHENNSVSNADNQTLLACDEASRNNVTIYTISFGSGVSDESKAVLTNCATVPANYYDAADAAALNAAFQAIANDIYRLRLSS